MQLPPLNNTDTGVRYFSYSANILSNQGIEKNAVWEHELRCKYFLRDLTFEQLACHEPLNGWGLEAKHLLGVQGVRPHFVFSRVFLFFFFLFCFFLLSVIFFFWKALCQTFTFTVQQHHDNFSKLVTYVTVEAV